MHAGDCLLGVYLIDFIADLAVFLRNGKDPQRFEGFQGIIWFWMKHANAKGNIVTGVDNRQDSEGCKEGPLGKALYGKRDRHGSLLGQDNMAKIADNARVARESPEISNCDAFLSMITNETNGRIPSETESGCPVLWLKLYFSPTP